MTSSSQPSPVPGTLEDDTRILEILNRTGAALASMLDVQDVVQAVTDAATELSGAEFGAFFYTAHGTDGAAFTLYTLSGAPREAFEHFGHPRATPIFAPTFHGEGVVRIDDVRADPRFGQMAPHHGMPPGHLPVCSYLAVPVISRSREVIGGLFFGHRERGVFSERSERLIVGIAAQAAIAIDNARLYEEARRAADERARLLEAERAARAEIERISLVKDEFLATLSHELRTPLSAMLGWSESLLSRSPEDKDTRRGLETIARNARAQARLIEDLLDMSAIVSGKLRLDVQRVDLAAVVSAALDAIRPSAEAKGIAIERRIDAVGAVFGDAARLQQVVWNLLSNAVKFTPRGGHIDVRMQQVEAQAEIRVRDSGIGIAADFLPLVFERFRQADSSTRRRHGGLGLGLSIVKQLVELHGGSVHAESDGGEQGATFVIHLPVRPGEVEGSKDREAPSYVSLTGVRVLVVDDDPDARELIRAVLVAAAAEVTTAGSTEEALELLARAGGFDVMVSDVGMPGQDGYDLIRELRRRDEPGGRRTPAIALTGFAGAADRTRALQAGYELHVSKPIEPRVLVATVRSLVGPRGPSRGPA